MKASAIVLAAGRGERMRPLTDLTPKPLLEVKGKPLLQLHLEALIRGNNSDVMINTAWLGEQIPARFGDKFTTSVGSVNLHYSHEGVDFGGALETAGGISRVLPYMANIFWVVAADIHAPYFVFHPKAVERFSQSSALAHIWLVPNPPHNPNGDFYLDSDGVVDNEAPEGKSRLTYSTIGLYRKQFFLSPNCNVPSGNKEGIKAPLAPLLRSAMENGRVTGEIYKEPWTDVGTPERLQQLNTATELL